MKKNKIKMIDKTQNLEDRCKKQLTDFLKESGQSITFIAKQIKTHPGTIYGWLADEKTISMRIWCLIESYIDKQ